MGHELFHDPSGQHIGSVSLRRWEEVSKLLPLLVDFVNRAVQQDWQVGTARDVRLLAGGATDPPVPPPDQSLPGAEPFELGRMLSEDLLGLNEIHVAEVAEWGRLFAWCDFLAGRDGAYAPYRPLVDSLRASLADIARPG